MDMYFVLSAFTSSPIFLLVTTKAFTTESCNVMLWKEKRPPVWRIAANILNKLLQTYVRGWLSILGFGQGANKSSM